MYKATQQEKAAAVATLCSLIRDAKPRSVVSVLKRISRLVEIAANEAKVPVRFKALPYPTYNGIKEYYSELRLIVSELEKI